MTGQHDFVGQDKSYTSNASEAPFPNEYSFPLYDHPPPPPPQEQYQPPPAAPPQAVYAPSPESAEGGHHAGPDTSAYMAGNELEERDGNFFVGMLLGFGLGFFFSFYGFFALAVSFAKKTRKGLIVGLSIGCLATIALAVVIIVNYSSLLENRN